MSVSRDKLYEEVWAEPITTVAKRYEVSGSFLARICKRLRVPRPPRGYWAKLAAGKTCKRPGLPLAQPGDELEWSREGEPRRMPRAIPQPPSKVPRKRRRTRSERPSLHELITAARENFDNAQELTHGYLRPQKRLLFDLVVTKGTLTRSLDFANTLFLALEDRGHRVVMPPQAEYFSRAHVEVRETPQRTEMYPPLWHPARRTVAYIGTVAIGLTLFEIAESVEVRWVDGKYVRAEELVPKRRRGYPERYSWTSKQEMPSGRLCLQAYSPYPKTSWVRQWSELKPGDIASKVKTIIRELEKQTSAIAELVNEAERKAELERQRWEAQKVVWERERAERKRAEALKKSREDLFEIIEAWGEAKRIEGFFQDAERRVKELADEAQRDILLQRLQAARALLEDTDAFRRFLFWKAPEER